MFIRLLKATFKRQKRRVILAILAVAIGASLVTALLNISLSLERKVQRDLRKYGANILVIPKSKVLPLEIGGINYRPEKQAYLSEADLPKIKTIFWKNNILGFSPYLDGLVTIRQRKVVLSGTWFEKELKIPQGKSFKTGAKKLSPWWEIKGDWPQGLKDSLVGETLAKALKLKVGDSYQVFYQGKEATYEVKGILSTGGGEENQIFVPLEAAQSLLKAPGKFSRLLVSALIVPEKRKSDPQKMSPKEYEKWYCSPYARSIAKQIEEVVGGSQAKPLAQVVEAEGRFLKKTSLLVWLLLGITLTVSSFGVSTTMMETVLERKEEIGLVKALGASDSQITLQFFLEAGSIGLLGGLSGFLLGSFLSWLTFFPVFKVIPSFPWLTFFLSLGVAELVALLGSILPARRAMGFLPASIFRGE